MFNNNPIKLKTIKGHIDAVTAFDAEVNEFTEKVDVVDIQTVIAGNYHSNIVCFIRYREIGEPRTFTIDSIPNPNNSPITYYPLGFEVGGNQPSSFFKDGVLA